MTQIWRRWLFVGLMAVHAIAFGVFWGFVGFMLLAVGVGEFYQTVGPRGDELEFFRSSFNFLVNLVVPFWIWTLLFMIHIAIFLFSRNRQIGKLKRDAGE
jgi:hypothetical protein